MITKVRNGLWKSVDLFPKSHRLMLRCALVRAGVSRFEPEWHAIDRFSARRATALDIGANRGLWSWELARYYDRVIAFEPNESITAELVAAASPKIEVRNIGLSDECGRTILHLPINEAGVCCDGWASLDPKNLPDPESTVERDVEIRTLDSVDLPPIDFIKIDVEGHEVSVIRGGMNLLTKHRPVVLAEIRESNLDEFSSLMEKAGLTQWQSIRNGSDEMFLFGPESCRDDSSH